MHTAVHWQIPWRFVLEEWQQYHYAHEHTHLHLVLIINWCLRVQEWILINLVLSAVVYNSFFGLHAHNIMYIACSNTLNCLRWRAQLTNPIAVRGGDGAQPDMTDCHIWCCKLTYSCIIMPCQVSESIGGLPRQWKECTWSSDSEHALLWSGCKWSDTNSDLEPLDTTGSPPWEAVTRGSTGLKGQHVNEHSCTLTPNLDSPDLSWWQVLLSPRRWQIF